MKKMEEIVKNIPKFIKKIQGFAKKIQENAILFPEFGKLIPAAGNSNPGNAIQSPKNFFPRQNPALRSPPPLPGNKTIYPLVGIKKRDTPGPRNPRLSKVRTDPNGA